MRQIIFPGSGPLKEEHRKEMIIWSDKVRTQMPTFFCLEAFKTGLLLRLKCIYFSVCNSL